jgi:diguanylate cyclase (GGDEF)-like protein/putative nucleotidyltransferase with HDIG domain
VLLAVASSGIKLPLPQIVGTLSINFVFVLLGILELSLAEALLMGCAGTAVQVFVHRERSRVPVPALFHIGNTAIAVMVAYHVFHAPWALASPLAVILAASVLYAMNTLPLALVVGVLQKKSVAWVWRECNFRLFPYYIAGGVLAGVFHFSQDLAGADSPLFLLPVAILTCCMYYSYQARVGKEQQDFEAKAALNLRMIESLAMAIEAKDLTSHDHLRRLQRYCTELGRACGMNEEEVEAVRAAAVLHDIGKLAVPEHILSKPGKLSREEFEKVKIHPVVGAQILERAEFPGSVTAIVRSHHEKWNGSGYPSGLRGEAIPLGARILAVVDCFDALISERPYRRAMPFEQAVSRVAAEAGVSFDPKITQLLAAQAGDIEASLRAEGPEAAWTLHSPQWDSAFFAPPPRAPRKEPSDPKPQFLDTIAAARQEAQLILELTQQMGNSLHLDETFSDFSTGLRRLVPYETLVIYAFSEDTLVPRYAAGECTALFLARHVPVGQGIAGWVAQNRKAILNGNPSVEMGGGGESMRSILLNSALGVPLAGAEGGVSGVLLLARRSFEGFTREDLRIILALSAKLGSVISNGIRYEQVAATASTDFLTGLPNARALHAQLESELARSRRTGGALAVLVTDLDGFKEVNDRFGHLQGNAVLKAVAQALRESCREYDYVARLGGDEFVILLPGLAEEDVQLKIAQLNQVMIAAGRKVVPESSLGLSVGQSRYPADGEDPESLLAKADQNMYQVKTTRKLKQHRHNPRGFEVDWVETSVTP